MLSSTTSDRRRRPAPVLAVVVVLDAIVVFTGFLLKRFPNPVPWPPSNCGRLNWILGGLILLTVMDVEMEGLNWPWTTLNGVYGVVDDVVVGPTAVKFKREL